MDIITCVGKVQETEFVRSRSEPGRNCKNNKKFAKNPLYMEGFVCYTTEVASHAHLLRVQNIHVRRFPRMVPCGVRLGPQEKEPGGRN